MISEIDKLKSTVEHLIKEKNEMKREIEFQKDAILEFKEQLEKLQNKFYLHSINLDAHKE